MKRYPVSYVQIHICELLEELPFQITRYGKVIAVVNRFNTDSVTVQSPENKTNVKLVKVGEMCPHNLTYHKGCHYV